MFAGPLHTKHCYANNAALAIWQMHLAGHTRALYEHATGAAVGDNPACAEPNPRGAIGEDHSGQGYGRELKHTFWNVTYGPGAITSGCDSFQQPPMFDTTAGRQWALNFWVPVPAAWPGSRYESCQLTAIYQVHGAITTGTAVLYASVDDSAESSIDCDQAVGLHKGTATLLLSPGTYNTLRIRFVAAGVDGYRADLLSLALSQVG